MGHYLDCESREVNVCTDLLLDMEGVAQMQNNQSHFSVRTSQVVGSQIAGASRGRVAEV